MAISFGNGELQGELIRVLKEIDARLEAAEEKVGAPPPEMTDIAQTLESLKAENESLTERVAALEAKAVAVPSGGE